MSTILHLRNDINLYHRGVEFGLETKALLFKRLCAYAGLHAEVRDIDQLYEKVKNTINVSLVTQYQGYKGPLYEKIKRTININFMSHHQGYKGIQ